MFGIRKKINNVILDQDIENSVMFDDEEKKLNSIKKVDEYIEKNYSKTRFVLSTEKNNSGDSFYILASDDSEEFLLDMISTDNFMDCQKSIRKIIARSISTVFNADNIVKIEDVIVDEKNCDLGNGSILLQNLEQLCKIRGKTKIVGSLKWVDKENFEKLEHFYKKNGFVVTFNEERTGGKIVKTLE